MVSLFPINFNSSGVGCDENRDEPSFTIAFSLSYASVGSSGKGLGAFPQIALRLILIIFFVLIDLY